MAHPTKTNPSENAPSGEEKAETPGSSSSNANPAQNTPNVIVEHAVDSPKKWTNHNLMPAYFVTLEKYFATRNILDENARLVALPNVNRYLKQLKMNNLTPPSKI